MSVPRPVVSVYNSENLSETKGNAPLPSVFKTPIRTDIVNTIHAFLRMNLRQPYSVTDYAGHDYSAISWGTGRAVSRIPRVSGGGTHRAGQGAFGNMCRGGRMFAPTKTFRRWAHKVNANERRYATASAIAASGVTALVMARGHRVDGIKEIPFVVSDDLQSYTKTKNALQFLKRVKAINEVYKVKNSKNVRAGVGKSRNRKYKTKLGPLVIYKDNKGVARAFKNIPGVDTLSVDRLNLLKLAPGGHVGRFIIWTESAFRALETRFGSYDGKVSGSAVHKRTGVAYRLPRPVMENTDVTRIVESDQIQAALNPIKLPAKRSIVKKNPLKNFYAMVKLNPLALRQKRRELLQKVAAATAKQAAVSQKKEARSKKIQTNFYDKVVAPLATSSQ